MGALALGLAVFIKTASHLVGEMRFIPPRTTSSLRGAIQKVENVVRARQTLSDGVKSTDIDNLVVDAGHDLRVVGDVDYLLGLWTKPAWRRPMSALERLLGLKK